MTSREFEKLKKVDVYRITKNYHIDVREHNDGTLWAARVIDNKIEKPMQVQRMPDGSIETVEVKNG